MSETSDLVGDLIRNAIPVNVAPPAANYITREEFEAKIDTLETKIQGEATKTKLWVVSGCLAIIVSFGGGYMSLVSKLDRLNEAMPIVNQVLDGRRSWMLRKDQQDAQQDGAIKSAVPAYTPLPYAEPPK